MLSRKTVVIGFLSLLGSFALRAAEDRITRPVDPGRRQVLRNRARSVPARQFDRGPADPALQLESVTLVMKPAPGLDRLIADQQNPASPEFHKWLTPEQFAERFGLSSNDSGNVTAWLQSQGLRVERVARGRHWITFSGSVDRINRAFDAEIRRYDINGETHFANAGDTSIPEALATVVDGLEGLSDFGIVPMHVKPLLNAGNNRYLAPDDFATIYNTKELYNAGIDGRGQSIAVVGQSTIDLADIRAFRARFNLPPNDPQLVLAGANPGRRSGDFIEANLDVQWAGAVAPNANIIYVYSPSVVTSLQYAVDQNLAPIITMSYGGCEQNFGTASRYIAQQANAQGITWLVASGDWGAATCDLFAPTPQASKGLTVSWPSSIPEVTAVGGTRLNANGSPYWSATNNANGGSALSYIPERAWNDSVERRDMSSGGGGASVYYAKPVWQAGPGVPAENTRYVPDISFASSPQFGAYQIVAGGSTFSIGGTSAAAPAFAGILALVNQYLIANGALEQPGLGNVNPMLYRLAQTTSDVFHDVTVGHNKVPCAQGSPNCEDGLVGYSTGAGYDPATGLGSVDAYKLATSWTPGPGTRTTVTATPNDPGLEDTVEITAVISGNGPSMPTGTVTFSTGGAQLGAAQLTAGIATLKVAAMQIAGGNGMVAAVYSGDSAYDGSAGNVAIDVNVPPGGSVVIPFITPNPVYQSGSVWPYTIRLSEKAGVATRITSFSVDGGPNQANLFGSGEIAANGSISQNLQVSGLTNLPRNRTFVVGGADADGRTWTREVSATFVGPAGPPLAPSMTLISTPGAVPRNPQAGAECQWSHQLTVQEESGFTVELTGFAAGTSNLTSQFQQIFGTTRLAPFGSLQGTVCWSSSAASRAYQLTGSAENGATVSASATVGFAGQAANPATLSTDAESITFSVSDSSETSSGAVKVHLATGDWRVSLLPGNRTTGWLSVAPLAGTGPGEVTIRANATGLSKGAYRALLTIHSGDALPQSITVPVTFVVGASSTMRIGGVVNTFSGAAAFAPGMLASVYGSELAPAGTLRQAPGLPLPLTLAGVSGTVNGISTPLYFVSPGQINLQIPYEAGSGPAVLAINNNGQIAHFPMRISTTAPGIATAPGGSLGNGRSGERSVMYITGEGDVTPSVATGAPSSRLPRPRLPVVVTVGGIEAPISFSGIPSWAAGVAQINFTVPANLEPGPQPVVVTVGGIASPPATLNVVSQ